MPVAIQKAMQSARKSMRRVNLKGDTIQYAANGFLAMKISFINSVAAMCEQVGAVFVFEVSAGKDGPKKTWTANLRDAPGKICITSQEALLRESKEPQTPLSSSTTTT